MHKKTAHQISHRTLDYLSRKHPWFDALMRNRWIAITALTVYAAIVALMIGHVYNGEEGGWKEIIKNELKNNILIKIKFWDVEII